MMYGYDMMGGSWMMTGFWGFGHILFFAAFAALVLYPIGRILQRLGFSPLWSVVALLPLANLVGLWVLATVPWPREWSDAGVTPASSPIA
ncbi:MAG TPA: hypothetical protein VH743_01005 [Beijerinckiaceae bacterium]